MPKGFKKNGEFSGEVFQAGHKTNLGKHWELTKETKRKMSKSQKGRKLSEEHRRKLSERMKGKSGWNKGKKIKWNPASRLSKEKHWNWKGGLSFEPYTTDWTETLKRSIRERDNYICQLCSQYGNNVHHIDYDKKNCNPDNLITLCRKCNVRVNYQRNYWRDYFTNPIQK